MRGSCFIFDTAKGWTLQGIANLVFYMHLHPLQGYFMKSSPDDGDSSVQNQIQLIVSLDCSMSPDGKVSSSVRYVWNVWTYEHSTNDEYVELRPVLLESHYEDEEDLAAWLWDNRDRLLISESACGWDNDLNRFLSSEEFIKHVIQ